MEPIRYTPTMGFSPESLVVHFDAA